MLSEFTCRFSTRCVLCPPCPCSCLLIFTSEDFPGGKKFSDSDTAICALRETGCCSASPGKVTTSWVKLHIPASPSVEMIYLQLQMMMSIFLELHPSGEDDSVFSEQEHAPLCLTTQTRGEKLEAKHARSCIWISHPSTAWRELGMEVQNKQRLNPGADPDSFPGLKQGIYISMELHRQRNNLQCLCFSSCETGIGARWEICGSFYSSWESWQGKRKLRNICFKNYQLQRQS